MPGAARDVKYVVVVPDGAADLPLCELDGRTPLEAAHIPHMDRAAAEGLVGLANNVPPRMTPGSAVAMMSLVGYDPTEHFTGRAPLEAADMGLTLEPGDWAVRCNLVTVDGPTLVDFTAGHVSDGEAGPLIQALNEGLGEEGLSFHAGTSYRHVALLRGPRNLSVQTTPPHDIVGLDYREHYPRGEGGELLVELMERSREVLAEHPVNRARVERGERPANMIWLWGHGQRPDLPPFAERFGVRGAVISAVNLVRGIGVLVGWRAIRVPGATGYVDTDYAAKGRHALHALGDGDLVLVHVEAPDEASHERDAAAKVTALERIDRDIVGPVMAYRKLVGRLRLLIVPDHVTSVQDGMHRRGAVPFAMWGDGVEAASGGPYTEGHCGASGVALDEGWRLMGEFIGAG